MIGRERSAPALFPSKAARGHLRDGGAATVVLLDARPDLGAVRRERG